MDSIGLKGKWSQVRLLVLTALLMPAAYLAGENLGYRGGIQTQIGGPGRFDTALIEWQNINSRKVVVYLNDGANGYSFWMTLDPGFRHYTAAAKVFTCDNTNRKSIKNCLEMSRAWARDDWEGGETRITRSELQPSAGDDRQADEKNDESLASQRYSDNQELQILRADVNRMALKIDSLERELAAKE